MSEDMGVPDKVNGDEPRVNGEDEPTLQREGMPGAVAASEDSEASLRLGLDDSDERGPSPQLDKEVPAPAEEVKEPRGRKRRASSALSDESPDDFRGFEKPKLDESITEYNRVLERIEAEVTEVAAKWTPTRRVATSASGSTSTTPRANKRARPDTDGSRPSSALSLRSDGDAITSSTDVASSAASSPAGRSRRPETSSPLLRVPLERGWRRELVYRAALDAHSRRNADVYYYSPTGKKLRSTREVAEHIAGSGLTLENFSFFKEPLGVDDPEKETIRDAKFVRRVESPVAPVSSPAVVEGKRTPKPKAPKGASPEPASKSPANSKLKVKSVGSRLSGATTNSTPNPTKGSRKSLPAGTDNNNSTSWKKPSAGESPSVRRRGAERTPNGAAQARGRGRPSRGDSSPHSLDHFTAFYNTSLERNYDVVVQIFQYLGMRELAHCARVCRLWRSLASTPSLWRHVRMKNSQVSDWGGLCAALKQHGTKRLDLRKMLLPPNDDVFWGKFATHIPTVDTLERIELCRCPAKAVEAVCSSLPKLCSLSALAVRDSKLDPAPIANLPLLHELRIKSMTGLSLASDLSPLAKLTHLQHLSLTSIKELGGAACEVVGSLRQLVSLELGECTFGAEFGAVLARLTRLQRLRLERGTAECAAPALLRALATLPQLRHLELINFDVKVGFDDALAECRNVHRLLIIPTYVSQSATTNKQVLSGVLRLKDTLTHLMWGITIELLRVTELFIDQCDQGGEKKKADIGECIPVLKPVPGLATLPDTHHHLTGPPQVEILPLPSLQRLLSSSLPATKLKLLRIPFHATWRQSLADFQ